MKALKFALVQLALLLVTIIGFAQEWDYELGVVDINTTPIDYNSVDDLVANDNTAFYVLDKNGGTELYAFNGSQKQMVFSSEEDINLVEVLDNGAVFRIWEVGISHKLYFVDNETLEVSLLLESELGFIEFVRLGDRIIFSNHSDQLFSTDGTPSGTYLLRDYNDFDGELQVRFENLIIYSADDKLWRTDGTFSGTYSILNDAPFIFSPDGFVESNGKLFFQMTSGAIELWSTEGTPATTEVVYSGFYSQIFAIAPTANGIVFSMSDASTGMEIWTSDGTEMGTHILIDINPGVGDGIAFGNNFRYYNGFVYFKGGLDYTMPQLWRTDGTLDNTEMLVDFSSTLNYNSSWIMGDFIPTAGSRAIFATNHTSDHETLWSVGETGELTELAEVDDIYYQNEVFELNGQIFYINGLSNNEDELWRTDGTINGTELLYTAKSVEMKAVHDDKLLFTCRNLGAPSLGEELYISDGTAINTGLLKDIKEGEDSSFPDFFFSIENTSFFTAKDDLIGLSIYAFDGQENSAEAVVDINSNTDDANLLGLRMIAGRLYFENEGSLFSSDGTAEDTQNLNLSGAAYYDQGGVLNGKMVFGRGEGGIYITDGSLAGTQELMPVESGNLRWQPVLYQSKLYFIIEVEYNEYQLWKTDGTIEGTEMALDLSDSNQDIHTTIFTLGFTAFQGMLYFVVHEPADNTMSLWKTDGTEGGAVLVKNFGTAGAPPFAPGFIQLGQLLYFYINADGATGMWSTDGTEPGTNMVTEGFFTNPIVSNNLIFFETNSGLWRTDGTAEGSILLTPEGNNFSPNQVARYEDGVIFSLYTSEYNYEPWISDGTPEGTHILKVIGENGYGSSPHDFTAVENLCIFTANSDEIWVTDGTEENTFSLGYSYNELNSPEEYTLLQDKLFFIASNQIYGEELFYFDLNRAPSISGLTYIDENENGALDEGESVLPGLALSAENIEQNVAYSGQDGIYNFYLLEEGNYTVKALENECWELTTEEQYSVTLLEDGVNGLDFGFRKIEGETTLRADVQSAPTRCGFTVPFWTNIYNTGCQELSGKVEIILDANVALVEYDPASVEIDGQTMSWVYENVPVSNYLQLPFQLEMPGEEAVGEDIEIIVNTYIGTGDDVQLFDTYTFTSAITCAIDPNDKLVRPSRTEESNSNYTQIDETLFYTIRFQNTGNDTAFTVRILDQLAPELDWETFQPLSASHNYKTSLSPYGEVEFLFENILLPDSTTNEPGSHGYVAFSIELKEGLEDFTEVKNTAHIYFDYNSAIVTNTITNTIVEHLDFDEDGFPFWEDCDDENPEINPDAIEIPDNGIDEDCDGEGGPVATHDIEEGEFLLFPNPTSGIINIIYSGLITKIEVTDALGRGALLEKPISGKVYTIDISFLPQGIYFIRCYDSGQNLIGVEKVIKR